MHEEASSYLLAVAIPLVKSTCCMQTCDMVQQGCLQVVACLPNVVRCDRRTASITAGSELLERADDGWLLSDKAVLWAKSTVWSRAFNIPYLGQPLHLLPCTTHSASLLSLERSP